MREAIIDQEAGLWKSPLLPEDIPTLFVCGGGGEDGNIYNFTVLPR